MFQLVPNHTTHCKLDSPLHFLKKLVMSIVCLFSVTNALSSDTIRVQADYILSAVQGFGSLAIDRNVSGAGLVLKGTKYAHGLGTHAKSSIDLYIPRGVHGFDAIVGLDDETLPGKGSVQFVVLADADTIWRSGIMHTNEQPKLCSVHFTQIQSLRLVVLDAGDGTVYDHADWCDAVFIRTLDSAESALTIDTIPITRVDVETTFQSYKSLVYDSSVEHTRLRVADSSFTHGFGTHAESVISLALPLHSFEFRAWVGLDNSSLPDRGSAEFFVVAGSDTIWRSGIMRTLETPKLCRVRIDDLSHLLLVVSDAHDGNSYDHADWCDPFVTTATSNTARIDTLELNANLIAYAKLTVDTVHYNTNVRGSTMKIGSQSYERGIGHNSDGVINILRVRDWVRFEALVGLDAGSLPKIGSAEFFVITNRHDTVWRSGIMRSGDAARLCSVDLRGVYQLSLAVSNGGDNNNYDHCDWAQAQIHRLHSAPHLIDTIPLASVCLGGLSFEETPTKDVVLNASYGGTTLHIGTRFFSTGLGVHAKTVLPLLLLGKARRFHAWVGPDMSGLLIGFGIGSVHFILLADGEIRWQSPVMHTGDEPVLCDVDLQNIQYCELIAEGVGNDVAFDHCSYGDAFFAMDADAVPRYYVPVKEAWTILTPKEDNSPHINGPSRIGVRPASPIIYRIPVSGREPFDIHLTNLPVGLTFDTTHRTISGSLMQGSSYVIGLDVTNADGSCHRDITFCVGDTIAYTPPMGWNSWMVSQIYTTQGIVLSQMKALIDRRLVDYGYSYVNIDDGWQGKRDSLGNVNWNSAYYPSGLAALADSVHNAGCHFGLYTSPGLQTCSQNVGSYDHERQDVETYARWGVDAIKSDWCSSSKLLDPHKDQSSQQRELYKHMGDAVAVASRDIVFMLDHYDLNATLAWGREVGGHTWRTGADAEDTWENISLNNGFRNSRYKAYAGRGHWNDFDLIPFGVSYGPGGLPHSTRLTANEHYTLMSLWCLGKSPLLLSFNLQALDTFTLNVIANREVLAIHQDDHPTAGALCFQSGYYQDVWSNEMSDGSLAVGLFNRDNFSEHGVRVPWEALGWNPSTKVRVRDLWRQTELGQFTTEFNAMVPHHGCMLLRMWKDTSLSDTPQPGTQSSLSIRPNPATHSFTAHFYVDQPSVVRLELYDALGALVHSQLPQYYPQGIFDSIVNLDVSIPPGNYLVVLRDDRRCRSSLLQLVD